MDCFNQLDILPSWIILARFKVTITILVYMAWSRITMIQASVSDFSLGVSGNLLVTLD